MKFTSTTLLFLLSSFLLVACGETKQERQAEPIKKAVQSSNEKTEQEDAKVIKKATKHSIELLDCVNKAPESLDNISKCEKENQDKMKSVFEEIAN